MVKIRRFFVLLVFTQYCLICSGQTNLNNNIELDASFNCTSVNMGELLELKLKYRNNTIDTVVFFPEAIIGICHNINYFITYDKPERIAFALNSNTNYDSLVSLNPREEYIYTFNIMVDSNFFYYGENEVYVYYNLFDNPIETKKRKRSRKKPKLSIQSPSILIMVKPYED